MTIRDIFDRAVAEAPSSVFQHFHDGNVWIKRTYARAQQRVYRASAIVKHYMSSLPQPADGVSMRFALMLENSADWQIMYLAIAGTGAVVVPMDPKLRANEAAHVLRDSGASVIFTSDKQRTVVEQATADLPDIVKIWDIHEAIEAVGPAEAAEGREWYQTHRPTEDTLASLIYTSGTTGRPKGAMLTHGCFIANAEQTVKRVEFFPTDNFLNVLPLFHAFSFMGNFLLPMMSFAKVSFIRNLRTIADDMLEVKPTILLAVPLLAEKLFSRIDTTIRKSMVAKGLFKFGFSRKIIARLIVERFGGKMRLIGIGGAPTSIPTLEGFQKIGLFVLEGYGITECAPGVAYPNPKMFIPGTVGPVLDGIEWKLSNQDDTGAGELLVKGPNVCIGYWHNEEGTKAAFTEDGFYRTGDIVRVDSHGNIRICGRSKALIVNREGKNIYPEEIEQALEHAPLIKDVVVIGYKVGSDPGEHVGAIIVPDEDAVKAHFKGRRLTREELTAFIIEYAQGVCRASVADYKQPRKFDVRFDPLERTGTMKVRRVVYKGCLDEQ